MKTLNEIKSLELNRTSLRSITGGVEHRQTGKNAQGLYTDVWSPNECGDYGPGSTICDVNPYEGREM